MPTATRTFRAFVSSTFEDLRDERNALAAPGGQFEELTKVCQRYGARFQAVDLRWGVREEAGHDQRTMEICLGEIERCQQTKIKPNFIVLLGDRYGWRPLPARIEAVEFEAVRERIADAVDRERVDEWYRLDENADPSEYLLKPRTGEFKDKDRWGKVEAPMHEALREAARVAGLAPNDLVKYEASATHQEILQGLGKTAEDREHVFAFFCKPSGPDEDPDLGKLKQFLREQLGRNVFEPRDTAELCKRVRQTLKCVVRTEARKFKSRPALELEVDAHNAFARDRAYHFMGRTDVLGAINDYIKGTDRRAMVVHGASGSGKSALMARASTAALANPGNAVVIRRFIGATPESSGGITLLRSLCAQIGPRYGVTEEIPLEFHSVERTFASRLALATAEQPLVLFIDALDQIAASDPVAAVTWLMPELPPHCRVVVSTTEVARSLERAWIFPLRVMPAKDAEGVLALWLHDAKRKLQDGQRGKVLDYYNRCGLPLYLKLAFEEARRWRSFDEPDICVLGDGLAGIIDALFARLSSGADHGKVLVSRSLGYLAAARYGLTEDEMLDVLTRDEDVWQEFDAAKRHDPPERRLPAIVWSRLYLDLEPYLTERTVPGGTAVSFYHRQLAERVEPAAFHHKGLAEYFAGQSYWLGANIPNQRKITELVRQQVGAGLLDDVEAVLTDLDFISAKCAAELVFDLEEDYRQGIAAQPEAQTGIQEEERRAAEVARWIQTLIECAEQKRLPKPEEIIKSVEPWSHERMAAESKRIVESPTRLDRLKAFAGFVEQELYPLVEFGKRQGFVVQHAFNSAPRGPVHLSGVQRVETVGAPLLLRRWPRDAPYNPKPALLRTLEGHWVTSVSMTPDGRRAVSGSLDNTLRVWNLKTGESTVLQGHTNWVTSVSVTPDGQRAVSGSEDNTLRVWNLGTGESTVLRGHTKGVQSVSVTADGRRAVSGSGDGTLRVWNLETGEDAVLRGHTDEVTSVSATPDGRRAVSGSGDSTLRVWNLETGESRVLRGHTGWVASVNVTPDGRRAVSGSWGDNTLRLWNLETGEGTVLRGHTGWVAKVSVTPDGRRAVSGGGDNTLRVWNLETGESTSLKGHTNAVGSVGLTPDGRRAVSGSDDKTLRVWNLETGESTVLEGHTKIVRSVSVTPDGRRVLSGSGDKTLRAWNPETGESMVLPGHTGSVESVSVTADGRRAVSGSWDKTLRVWNLETGESRALQGHTGEVRSVSVTPGGFQAVSGSLETTLRVWNLETGEITVLQGHTDEVMSVSMTPDGRRAISGSLDKTLRVWNLETGESTVLQGHIGWVASVSVTPDGRRAVSGSWDNTVRAWNLDTGESTVLQGHTGWVYSVSVAPAGRRAMSGSMDQTLRVWNLETGACLAIARLNAPCTAVAATRDNRMVAGTSLGEVLFFDARGLDL